MENEMIVLNDDKLEATKEGIKFIKKLQKAKLDVQLMEEQLKEMFLKGFEETGTTKFVSPDGSFKATYYAETTSKRFDSKKLKEEQPELYEKYLTESIRKAYVKFS